MEKFLERCHGLGMVGQWDLRLWSGRGLGKLEPWQRQATECRNPEWSYMISVGGLAGENNKMKEMRLARLTRDIRGAFEESQLLWSIHHHYSYFEASLTGSVPPRKTHSAQLGTLFCHLTRHFLTCCGMLLCLTSRHFKVAMKDWAWSLGLSQPPLSVADSVSGSDGDNVAPQGGPHVAHLVHSLGHNNVHGTSGWSKCCPGPIRKNKITSDTWMLPQ